MSGALYGRQMQEFAEERHAEGLRLQGQHQDQHGICVSCGRNSPCADHVAGAELVTRYARFLAAHAPDQPALVRPYAAAAAHPHAGRHR